MIDEAAQAAVGRALNLSPETLAEALDPRAIVATRTGLGGAAPGPMREMLAECRESLKEAGAWREQVAGRLATAETELVELARKMAQSAREDVLL
jgi:argininosuccinate lyase